MTIGKRIANKGGQAAQALTTFAKNEAVNKKNVGAESFARGYGKRDVPDSVLMAARPRLDTNSLFSAGQKGLRNNLLQTLNPGDPNYMKYNDGKTFSRPEYIQQSLLDQAIAAKQEAEVHAEGSKIYASVRAKQQDAERITAITDLVTSWNTKVTKGIKDSGDAIKQQ